MKPNGIDIYHGNKVTDFAALKAAGILFVIHKCTQGVGYADPLYATRRKAATDAGLLWGAYCFNSGEPIKAQLNEFFSHAEPDENTLMALDFEDNPKSQMTIAQAKDFLGQGETRLGRKFKLYSGNRAKDLLGNRVDTFLGSHKLWLPQYGPVAKVQKSWSAPWLWQFSQTGRLPGTDGALDFNFYAGTPEQLTAEWA